MGIPQMNMATGTTYYFNLQTGATVQLHPHTKQVEAVRGRERDKAEKLMAQRFERLRTYKQQLMEAQEGHQQQLQQRCQYVQRHHNLQQHGLAIGFKGLDDVLQ